MGSRNLVPKHVTDKNGVTRTHWVVPEGADASRAPIPAPLASSQEQEEQHRAALMEDALTAFYPSGYDYFDNGYKNLWFLAQHSTVKLQTLMEQCESNEALKKLWLGKLDSVHMHIGNTSARSRSQQEAATEGLMAVWNQRLRVYPVAMEMIERIGDHGNNPGLLREYTNDLEHVVHTLLWSRRREGGEVLAPDDVVDSLALIGIMRGVYDSRHARADNKDLLYADISSDVEYVRQNLGRVRDAVPEIVQRGVYDFELLQRMINSSTSSLNSGEL